MDRVGAIVMIRVRARDRTMAQVASNIELR